MSLPETHTDPYRMVRALITYIPDAKTIRSAVLSEFDSAPSIKRIVAMQGVWKRQKEAIERGPHAPGSDHRGWDWTGEGYAKAMERASKTFIYAIERSRTEPRL